MTTKSFETSRVMPQFALPGFGTEMQSEQHRLFFALLPDDEARNEIVRVAESLRTTHRPRGSWIARDRYHVTLHFLGESSELRQEQIDRAVAAAAKVRLSAFDIVFDTASSFRSPEPPWILRCPEPAQSVRQLWQALQVALAGEKIRTESASAFTPHLTLLRGADNPLAPSPIAPIRWRVGSFALIHSRTGRERRYSELGRWLLPEAAKP